MTIISHTICYANCISNVISIGISRKGINNKNILPLQLEFKLYFITLEVKSPTQDTSIKCIIIQGTIRQASARKQIKQIHIVIQMEKINNVQGVQ